MDALLRHRMLTLAGVEVRALTTADVPWMHEGPDEDYTEPEADEPEAEDDDEDDDDDAKEDDGEPMRRHRMLELLGVELRARARTNPAPGRQVISREGMKHYGLPMGATIVPGMRRLSEAQQKVVADLPEADRKAYQAARKDGSTHTKALAAAKGTTARQATAKIEKALADSKQPPDDYVPRHIKDVLDHLEGKRPPLPLSVLYATVNQHSYARYFTPEQRRNVLDKARDILPKTREGQERESLERVIRDLEEISEIEGPKPAKKAAPRKAAAKKAQPSLRPAAEGSIADLPEDQRRAYRAVLRQANTGRLERPIGNSATAKQRRREIDDLVAEGYLEADGDGFVLTDKGRAEVGGEKSFDEKAATEKFEDADPTEALGRESVLGGPMDEVEEALHKLSAADIKRVAEELNVSKPVGGPWPASKAARIRYLLTSLDDAFRRDRRAHSRHSIPKMIDQLGLGPKGAPDESDADTPSDPTEALRDELDLKPKPDLRKMLDQINAQRREQGLKPLPVSGTKRQMVDRLVEHQAGGVGPKADAGLTGDQQEQAARDRLARIDAVRGKAETVAEALELLDSEASEKALKHRINARLTRGSIDEPTRDRLLAAVDADHDVEVENRIRAAYVAIKARPFTPTSNVDLRQSGWVRMADIRAEIGDDLPRQEVDAALLRLAHPDSGNAIPESAQWLLRPEDRAAALRMGGQNKHWLQIDDPSPRPGGNLSETVKALAAENGFTLTAQPGDVVAWRRDSGLLSASRHGFREGQMVRVFRPGVQYDPGDGRVLIVAGLAEEATPDEIAKARQPASSFDERIGAARQGRAVERMVPVRVEVDASSGSDVGRWRATEVQGLAGSQLGLLAAITRRVRDSGHLANSRLRFPDGRPMEDWEIKYREGLSAEQLANLDALDADRKAKDAVTGNKDIKAIDKAMAQSKLPSDAVVWRGIRPRDINLPDGDATNFEWIDPGYVGTSATRDVAENDFAQGALLRVLLPAGTPAIGIRGGGEGELLLNRGLRYRVVADRREGGSRVLDVEVVEEATPEEIAAARLPRAVRDRIVALELRALGADVTPGNDQLHHYWTRGEGLAKWRLSPHPWTTLVALLTEHVGPQKAKVFASKWLHEVFGYWPGHRKGKNPVGPG